MTKVQKIYNNFGKFDSVVTIIFIEGSISYALYGNNITGQFYYTQKQRRDLELILNENPTLDTTQKFNIILKSQQSKENIEKASNEGIRIADIREILGSSENRFNSFCQDTTRSFDDPIIIEFNSSHLGNMDLAEIGLYKTKINHGHLLIEHEWNRFSALLLIYRPDEISDEFKLDHISNINGHIRQEVLYEKTQIEYYSGKIDEFSKEYNEMLNWRINKTNLIVKKELKKVGIESNKELLQNLWLYNFLLEYGTTYSPKILLYTNPPVFIDFESWMHIFLRHARPLMKGKHVQSRTPFQYALEDIFTLLEHLLDIIKDDIQEHYTMKGQTEYTKNGLYYNGDYYKIKLSDNGKVETIFKIQKPQLPFSDSD